MSVHGTGISAQSPVFVAQKGNARLGQRSCCVGILAPPYFLLTSNFISGKTHSSSMQNAYTRQQLVQSVFRLSLCSPLNELACMSQGN